MANGEAPGTGAEATADAGAADGTGTETGAGAADAGGGGAEPGWGDTGGGSSEALPDMRDEQPTPAEVMAAMEAAARASQGSAGQGSAGQPTGGRPGALPGGGPTAGESAPAGTAGSGPLTPAEQVAVLDAELERGTGEFDAMILEEQAAQRRETRERGASGEAQEAGAQGGGGGIDGGDVLADAGEAAGAYSTGGGMGGASRGGGEIPKDTAKYPPPEDIPDGNDDDVVARQLREAAMREPDPAIREKLWDEYRKYKGLTP